ncbi:MAG TPA: DUF4276 family protein [Chitinophagales bacterium]|nr:DUF4276 family protein [Chitinophagales bacterium]HRK25941.1 DUF4276 family protein [Chitinophagales bacterium]
MSIYINLVSEDAISEFTMMKLLDSFASKYYIHNTYPANGYGYIKSNINGFNQASIATPFFVLTDLDNYPCPPELILDWITAPLHPNFIFRIAVKEVEAWLLADIEGFSEFTGVSQANFPANPELENDPKQTLINLARRSRRRDVREDIVPINNNATIGPNYNERLMQFVSDFWNLERAIGRSTSLQRAFNKLDNFNFTQPA